jgi:hypothetical protein
VVQKYFAVFLVFLLSSLAAVPAFAGDYTNTKLLPHRLPLSASAALASSAAIPGRTTFNEMAGTLAFAPQQPGQAQSTPPAPARHWSRAGKIMTVIGAGLAVAGGIMMTKQNTTISSTSTTETQIDWKATGAGFIAGGAILAVVGLTRHSTD